MNLSNVLPGRVSWHIGLVQLLRGEMILSFGLVKAASISIGCVCILTRSLLFACLNSVVQIKGSEGIMETLKSAKLTKQTWKGRDLVSCHGIIVDTSGRVYPLK